MIPNVYSGMTTEDEATIKELSVKTGFTHRQVKQLQEKFNELARLSIRSGTKKSPQKPTLTPKDLLRIPAIKRNPLKSRIKDVFFSYAKDTRNMFFEEFVTVLSKFRSYSLETQQIKEEKSNEKLLFLFKIYDFDNNGYITHEDLSHTLRLVFSGRNLSSDAISQMATHMMAEMDRDGDGCISFEDFKQWLVLAGIDIDSKLTFPFLADLRLVPFVTRNNILLNLTNSE